MSQDTPTDKAAPPQAANTGADADDVYQHHGDNEPVHGGHEDETVSKNQANAYWRANLQLLVVLLSIWFVVSFGFGIFLVEPLNHISFFGAELGFWFAQQGSIYIFVLLIFIYAWRMHKIERRFGVDDD